MKAARKSPIFLTEGGGHDKFGGEKVETRALEAGTDEAPKYCEPDHTNAQTRMKKGSRKQSSSHKTSAFNVQWKPDE